MNTELIVKTWDEWLRVCKEFDVDPKTTKRFTQGSGTHSLTVTYEEKPVKEESTS